jgi:hydrogenase expression/formation protein HypD
VGNAYTRSVRHDGNRVAVKAMDAVFETCDAAWRGIGTIPASGLRIRPAFAAKDAAVRFSMAPDPTIPETEPGCRCGDVLLGRVEPEDCPLFGSACDTDHPVGPCMVSFEGTCAARYRHGGAR